MQPGFTMYEVGSISRLNAVNDIFKNFLNICAGALAFSLIGWDIQTGESFLTPYLADVGLARAAADVDALSQIKPHDAIGFLFQLGFATTAAAICSGAVTGRIRPHVYVAFAACYTGVTYPLIAFTVWHPQGLLFGAFQDFAGSVVVHSSGAAAGLAATLLLRPRIGFNGYDPVGLGPERLFIIAKRHAPHNIPLAALGASVLWIGWFGLTCGSLLIHGIPIPSGQIAAAAGFPAIIEALGGVATATLLAPAAAALTVTAIQLTQRQYGDVLDAMSGLIAGAVAVGAGANIYGPAEAILVGMVAGALYKFTRFLFERLFIDDPVATVAAHGFTGILGVCAVGFLKNSADPTAAALWQASVGIGLFSIVFLMSILFFVVVSIVFRLVERIVAPQPAGPRPFAMRVAYRTEVKGIDAALHGQDAYSFGSKEERLEADTRPPQRARPSQSRP